MSEIPDTIDPAEMVVDLPADVDGPSDAGIPGEDWDGPVPDSDDDLVAAELDDAAAGGDDA
jgi:hypothetical protein